MDAVCVHGGYVIKFIFSTVAYERRTKMNMIQKIHLIVVIFICVCLGFLFCLPIPYVFLIFPQPFITLTIIILAVFIRCRKSDKWLGFSCIISLPIYILVCIIHNIILSLVMFRVIFYFDFLKIVINVSLFHLILILFVLMITKAFSRLLSLFSKAHTK
jgi:hypothetical protein